MKNMFQFYKSVDVNLVKKLALVMLEQERYSAKQSTE